MRRSSFPVMLTAIVGALLALVIGCQTPVQHATAIRQSIQDQTAVINHAVDSAEVSISNADSRVQHAVTQPVPASAKADLVQAHVYLVQANGELTPIHAATTQISAKAVEAEQVTTKAVTDLKKEQSQWFSYKMRHAFYTIAGIVGLLGLGLGIFMFVVKTSGFGPLAKLFASISADIGGGLWASAKKLVATAWAAFKKIGVALYHVLTFGLSYLGDKVKALREGKTAAPKSVVSPAPHAGTAAAPLVSSQPVTQGPLISLHQ